MKHYIYFVLIFLLSSFILNSCKKDSISQLVEFNYSYYPYKIEQWYIYDIIQIDYNDFTHTVDTSKYQIKEYYESEFYDNSDRNTLRIERYKRDSLQKVWTLEKVYFSNLTETTAERVEDNIRYVKLIFPASNGEIWDANIYNANGLQNYEYSTVDEPYILKNITYDSTLTVIQEDEETLINKDYAVEIYATNTGLIYKRIIHIKKEVTGLITKGEDYTCTLNSYGEKK